jgi:hypothetical protein
MIKNAGKCIGRIIPVFQLLLTGKTIRLHIHIDIHRVLHALLPAIWLCKGKNGDAKG